MMLRDEVDSVNHDEVQNLDLSNVANKIREYGMEGWRLIGYTQIPTFYVLVFDRIYTPPESMNATAYMPPQYMQELPLPNVDWSKGVVQFNKPAV